MEKKGRYWAVGALAGAANGFFGGGGGSLLVPLLVGWCGMEQRRAFATSVAVILPLCALSLGICLVEGGMDWRTALPYVLGGTAGGYWGGRWFKGVRLPWLKRLFGGLLICGGVRCLL